jgi:hypothetical protein
MALLGTLQVRLGLDSGIFSSKLNKFSRDAKGITSGINKGFLGMVPTKAILGGLAGIASGLSAISFARMIKGANDSIDAMGEVAGRLGIATSKLQEYRIAAKFAGVESEGLDKSLGFLARNLGNIRNGLDTGGKKVGILESLGLSSAEIQGADVSTVFEKVVAGLSKIEDPATRSATAISLFGKSAGELGLLFAEGAPALERSRELIRDLGLEINDLDATRAGQLNDNFDKLNLILDASKNKLAVELAPVVTDLTSRLLAAANEGQSFGVKIETGVQIAALSFDTLGAGITVISSSLTAMFNLFQAGMAGLAAAVTGFASDFVTAIGTTAPNAFNSLLEASETGLTSMKQGFADLATIIANSFVAAINLAIASVETLVNSTANGINSVILAANSIAGTSFSTVPTASFGRASSFDRFPVDRVDLGRVGTFGQGTADTLGSYSEGFGNEAKRQLGDAGESFRELGLAYGQIIDGEGGALTAGLNKPDSLAAGLKEATTYANDLTGALGGTPATGGGGGGGGGGGASGKGVAGALDDVATKSQEVGEALKLTGLEVGNVWTDSMQSISSAIDQFVETGKLNFKSLGDSILQTLASAAIKNAINSLFGTITGGSSGSTGNLVGSILKIFSGTTSFEGGGYTGSGPRSGGLDGRGGRLAMVHPNETVIDHEKVRGGARSRRGRGDGVNLTVPITLMPGVSKQELAEILPLLKRDIISTIPNLISRGGRYAAAYGQ